jgi:uncharacterized protein (TIGR03663 family)
MNRLTLVCGVCLLAVAAGALAIRLPRLALRPMHPDEANQAYKTGVLLEQGVYAYDAEAHHGPTLYYLTLPSLWAGSVKSFAQSDEFSYRVVPALFGVGVVLLLLAIGPGLGWPAAVVAGALAAISPAMVYYSRDYMQEPLLVFFTFGAIVAAWRYARSGSVAWAAAAGAMLGLMHATKETWVLAAVAMIVGLGLTLLWTRVCDQRSPDIRGHLRLRPLAWGAAAFVLAAGVLYSSFGTNWQGPWDSIVAYGSYIHTAAEPIHVHPWHYYLSLLVWNHPATGFTWSEGLIVGLAAVGAVAAMAGRGVGGAHLPLAILYSAIPYKTPWCVLSVLQAMTLLAGVGAVALVRAARWLPLRMAVVMVLAALVVQLAWQSYFLNFRLYADQRNPYVYAHTSADVLKLEALVDRLAAASPKGRDLLIQVITPGNSWPLPWYLRKFPQVGYWQEVPPAPYSADADVVITWPDYEPTLDRALSRSYNKQAIFGLRHGVPVAVYVDEGLWQAFLARQVAGGVAEKGNPSP